MSHETARPSGMSKSFTFLAIRIVQSKFNTIYALIYDEAISIMLNLNQATIFYSTL